MNSHEAKVILVLYRPASADAADPQVAEALQQVERDDELRQWFERHCAFQKAMREKLRTIPVPPHLREKILAGGKIVPVALWRWVSARWVAAAAVVFGLALAGVTLWRRAPDRFAAFRERMVQTALREYRMDVVTNDLVEIRRFLSAKGAPADYVLTEGLQKLQPSGAASLSWRGNPISMVCFDRGDRQMLFLFVAERGLAKDSPGPAPQLNQVNKLITASWTRGNRTYVLAGPDEPDFLSKYLGTIGNSDGRGK